MKANITVADLKRVLQSASNTSVVEFLLVNDNLTTQAKLKVSYMQEDLSRQTFTMAVRRIGLQVGQKVMAMSYTLDDCKCEFIGKIGVVESSGSADGQQFVYVRFNVLDSHRSCHFAFAETDLAIIND